MPSRRRTVGPTSQSAPPLPEVARAGAHGHQRHRIRGMGGVRPAGFRVHHHFAVAVVRGDQHRRAGRLRGMEHPPQAPVHGFHCLDNRGHDAGVPDHIGVGVIAEHEVVLGRADGAAQHLGDPLGAHRRRQVVGGHLLGRHQDPLLATVRCLDTTVEEIRHVRVLLRLRRPQLRPPGIGQHFRHDPRHGEGWIRLRKWKRLVVLRHGDEADQRGAFAPVESVEALERQRPANLPHPVAAIVETENAVAVPDRRHGRAASFQDDRLDEFVGFAAAIGLVHRAYRVGRRPPDAPDHRVVGQLACAPTACPGPWRSIGRSGRR